MQNKRYPFEKKYLQHRYDKVLARNTRAELVLVASEDVPREEKQLLALLPFQARIVFLLDLGRLIF